MGEDGSNDPWLPYLCAFRQASWFGVVSWLYKPPASMVPWQRRAIYMCNTTPLKDWYIDIVACSLLCNNTIHRANKRRSRCLRHLRCLRILIDKILRAALSQCSRYSYEYAIEKGWLPYCSFCYYLPHLWTCPVLKRAGRAMLYCTIG